MADHKFQPGARVRHIGADFPIMAIVTVANTAPNSYLCSWMNGQWKYNPSDSDLQCNFMRSTDYFSEAELVAVKD